MLRFLSTFAFVLSASAAVAADDHDAHQAELDGLHLLHAWTPAPEGSSALIFVEIENESDTPAILLGADTDIAQKVELVGFRLKDGAGVYEPLPQLPIAPGNTLVLKPNAVALQVTGLTSHLHKGDAFDIHVEFQRGEVEMTVQVEASSAAQHSHAGHNH